MSSHIRSINDLSTLNISSIDLSDNVTIHGKLISIGDSSFNGNINVHDICLVNIHSLIDGDNITFNDPVTFTNSVSYDSIATFTSSVHDIVDIETELDISRRGAIIYANNISLRNLCGLENDLFNIISDVSFQKNVEISKHLTVRGHDVSFNQYLFVGRDVSINNNLFVNRDVYINNDLFVGNDVSINNDLFVNIDVSVNNNIFIGQDVSINNKLFVKRDVSVNNDLFVGRDVSVNNKLFVNKDVSVNKDLFVGRDVSINNRLFVSNDISVKNHMFVGEDVSINNDLFVSNDISVNNHMFIGADVSINNCLFVSKDISVNNHLFVGHDVSINHDLFVKMDVSINKLLTVPDASFDKIGSLRDNKALQIVTDAYFQSNVEISNDLIVTNGKLIISSGDSSFNGNINVNDICLFNIHSLTHGDNITFNDPVTFSMSVSYDSIATFTNSVHDTVEIETELDITRSGSILYANDISLRNLGGLENNQFNIISDVSFQKNVEISNNLTVNTFSAITIDVGGKLTAASNVVSSDDRIKRNEKLIVNATETLSKLTPQIYDKYNNMDFIGGFQVETGLIAQEVYYNSPELRHLVQIGKDFDVYGNKFTPTPEEIDLTDLDIRNDHDYGSHGWSKVNFSSLNYNGLIAYLVKSNQELAKRITDLEAK